MGDVTARAQQPESWGQVADLPRPLAFVLSGGAASGATQVGMLAALRDHGVVPDLVVGTSVGAINGVMAAACPVAGPDQLAEVWRVIGRDEILGSSGFRCLPRLVRTRRHLFPPDALRGLIRRNVPVRCFDALSVRFVAVATEVTKGAPASLASGNLEDALLASAAIPGVFPRVEIDGEWYFDGGVTANVPVAQAIELGARSVLVLNSAPPPTPRDLPTNIAETMHYVASLLMRNQNSATAAHLGHRGPVLELPRTSPHGLGPFDFSSTAELIDRAYEATRCFLAGAAQPVPELAAVN